MRASRTQERGAALVELALGSLLFVSVLMLGIHLSETVFLSLKVQEAQQFAIWESTGRRTHLFSASAVRNNPSRIYQPVKQIYATADKRAERRFRDFDGRTSQDRGGGLTQVFTQAAPIQVACERAQRIEFDVGSGSNYDYDWYRAQRAQLRRFYQSPPALICRASSELRVIEIPRLFMQSGQDGYFKTAQVMRERIRVCGAGRAVNGACRGEFGVLTGDWALEGPVSGNDRDLNFDVPLDPKRGSNYNRPYRAMVRELFDAGKGSHGRDASRYTAMVAEDTLNPNRSPHDESEFFMSYRGAEQDYVDGLQIGGRNHKWNTSGVYFSDSTNAKKRRQRPRCFLGLPGCN